MTFLNHFYRKRTVFITSKVILGGVLGGMFYSFGAQNN
jgi:hypothetical protein